MTYFKLIIVELINCKTLRSFIFSDNQNITGFEDGFRYIIKLIKSNDKLRHINLAMSYLYEKYVLELREALKGKPILTLDLSSNFIGLNGCKKIAEWLKRNRSLKVLCLQSNTQNEFKKEGCDLITNALVYHNAIQHLDVSGMIITGFGDRMGNFLAENKTLKELKIRATRMNIDDIKHICKSVGRNETLLDFNMSENDTGSDKSIEFISSMIETNKNLKILSLDKSGISPKNCKMLFDAIEKNCIIENYSMNENIKMKTKLFLDFFIIQKNVKILSIANPQHIKVQEDVELIEKFFKEREDVTLKI